MSKRKKACSMCGRKEGSTKDVCGDEDYTPLGPVEKCETCGRWACPDCLHEADCCFADADEHAGEPTWTPPGWRLTDPPADLKSVKGILCYERIE